MADFSSEIMGLGHQIANLAPVLWKPMARGRVALRVADHGQEPLVEFNFVGHELDLVRFKVAFRRTVQMLMHEKVRELGGMSFPVKFTDRLRLLNRRSRVNAAKSTAIAKLIDLVPALGAPSRAGEGKGCGDCQAGFVGRQEDARRPRH